MTALHAAVLGDCDALDGIRDGQIDEPRACRFDPARIQCRGTVGGAPCLTALQVDVARRFYRGPVDDQGRHLYPDGEPYEAELTWIGRGALSEAGVTMMDETCARRCFKAGCLRT